MHAFAVTAYTTQHLLLHTPVHPVPSIIPCSVSMHGGKCVQALCWRTHNNLAHLVLL